MSRMERAGRGTSREMQEIRAGVIAVAVAMSFALIVDALLAFGETAHSRPVRGTVVVGWAIIAALALLLRSRHRLMLPVALMAITLVFANGCLVLSATSQDAWALAAHVLRVVAYLAPLVAMIRISTMTARERLESEAAFAASKMDLESRVQERTADLLRSTESLQNSEMRFRAFVSATSDVVYRMSPDWQEMRQLVGQDFISDTTAPDREWLSKYIHPDDQALVMATISEAIRNKDVFELEHRVVQVDGTLGWTFSRAIPLLDERGEITEWFGAASDVTARRQAEEKS